MRLPSPSAELPHIPDENLLVVPAEPDAGVFDRLAFLCFRETDCGSAVGRAWTILVKPSSYSAVSMNS